MNAKEEFLEHTNNLPKVIAATVFVEDKGSFYLQESYDESQYTVFLENLGRINYNNGWGRQKLFGYIWYEDGTWSERGEYDGSEWWAYRKCPAIHQVVNDF